MACSLIAHIPNDDSCMEAVDNEVEHPSHVNQITEEGLVEAREATTRRKKTRNEKVCVLIHITNI